jgi:hypothetical protein
MNIRDILGFGLLPTEDAATGRNDNIWQHLIASTAPYYGNNAGDEPFDDGPYSSHNQLLGTSPTVNYTNLPDPDPAGTYPTLGLDMRCNPFTLGAPYSRTAYIASPINYVDPIPQGTLDVFEGYIKASQTASKSYVNCTGGLIEFPSDPWFIVREDGPVWVYVTADVVNGCNKDLPDAEAATYFALPRGGNNDGVIDENVLVGDVIWLNSLDRFSEADNAVHLEADTAWAGPTFYNRYVDGVNTADYREPLPTAWAFRYQLNTEAGINTWVRAFKASTDNRTVYDIADSRGLSPYPYAGYSWGDVDLGPAALYASSCVPYTYWAWDEDENVNTVDAGEDPWSGTEAPIRPVPNLLPLETQEVEIEQFFLVGQSDGDAFGWLLFAWPGSNGAVAPDGDDDLFQTWMGVKYSGFGDYTAALSGAVMANYNCNSNEIVPVFNLGQYSFNPPAGPPATE